jgi:hypothetical protein
VKRSLVMFWILMLAALGFGAMCQYKPAPAPTPVVDSGPVPVVDAGPAPAPVVDAGPAPVPVVDAGPAPTPFVWLDCVPENTFKVGPIVKYKLGARMVRGFKAEPPGHLLSPRTVFWDPLNPTPLTQTVGSCVGYSECELLSTLPFGLKSTTQRGDDLYHLATVLDSFAGTWPPDDTGSDCESGAKAAQKLGFIVGYDMAYTIADIQSRLNLGPGILCSDWSTGMFAPDRCGLVHFDPTQVEGGHARAMIAQNVSLGLIGERNTWGKKYGTTRKGVSGYFAETYADVDRELQHGGAAVFPRVP